MPQQAREMIKIIKENDLVSRTATIGSHLYKELSSLSKSSGKDKILNLRGKDAGTFIAWDFKDAATRDGFVGKMKLQGVNIGCERLLFLLLDKVLI